MTAKTAVERVAALRQRRKNAGILRLEVFAAKADHAAITAYAAKLTQKRAKISKGEPSPMSIIIYRDPRTLPRDDQ